MGDEVSGGASEQPKRGSTGEAVGAMRDVIEDETPKGALGGSTGAIDRR